MKKIILKIDLVCYAGLYAGMNKTIFLETYGGNTESEKEKLKDEAQHYVDGFFPNYSILRLQLNLVCETQTIIKNEI